MATPATATETPDVKSNNGAAQILIKRTVCEGTVSLIIGVRTAEQSASVLARLPAKLAKSATKLAHTAFTIIRADTKTVKLLIKDRDVRTVHLNPDSISEKNEIAKADTMKALKEAVKSSPVPVIVALALPDGASPSQISGVGNELVKTFSGFGVETVKTFKYIPHTAMTVGKAALQVLANSPLVCGVHADLQARPL